MKNKEILEEMIKGIDEELSVMVFDNFDYDSALIGYTEDYRAVYDYDLMLEYLIKEQNFEETEALEWLEYNTIRALPYYGHDAPIIIHRI